MFKTSQREKCSIRGINNLFHFQFASLFYLRGQKRGELNLKARVVESGYRSEFILCCSFSVTAVCVLVTTLFDSSL